MEEQNEDYVLLSPSEIIKKTHKRTKSHLDNVVEELQKTICIEYKKKLAPDLEKIGVYIVFIDTINKEYNTNYSKYVSKYTFDNLPLKD